MSSRAGLRFVPQLKELRFLFCQNGAQSAGVRYPRLQYPHSEWSFANPELLCNNSSFLARGYPAMKKNNPDTPILIREASGYEPRVFARFGELPIETCSVLSIKTIWLICFSEFGKEKHETLAGM